MLVGIGYLFFIFSDSKDGIMGLAMKVILKDQLHLDPTKIASFFAIASMAWYFKPLAFTFVPAPTAFSSAASPPLDALQILRASGVLGD